MDNFDISQLKNVGNTFIEALKKGPKLKTKIQLKTNSQNSKIQSKSPSSLDLTNRGIIDVKAKGKRISGLKDMKRLTVGLIKMIYNIGLKKLRPHQSSFSFQVEDKKKFEEKISSFIEEFNSLENTDKISSLFKESPDTQELTHTHRHHTPNDTLDMLKYCSKTYNELFGKAEPVTLKIAISDILANIDCSKPSPKATSKIKKSYADHHLTKEGIKNFNKSLAEVRGKNIPQKMTHTFEVNGKKFTEEALNLSCKPGMDYLKSKNENLYKKQIKALDSIENCKGIRVSALKKESHLQGMVMNARSHSVKDSNGKTLHSSFRSGAFAIHGKGKMGLKSLKEKRDNISRLSGQKQQKALKKLGFESLNKLNFAIHERQDLAISQALPKLTASINDMLGDEKSQEMAKKTGSFLHVEKGFLSHLNASEKGMIEDTYETLKCLKDNIRIHLVDEGEDGYQGLQIDDEGLITLEFKRPENFNTESHQFNLSCHLFSMGVNEQQSMGHAFRSDDPLQDDINKETVEALNAYFLSADLDLNEENMDIADTFKALNNHFSTENERTAKDIEGVKFISKAIEALNGRIGLLCKSGKDRTGTETINDHTRAISKSFSEKENIDLNSIEHEARHHLGGGISYQITGQNTGKPNAYAFNKAQYATLPKDWRVDEELCGNVES